ncbi:ATP-binding protein [Pinisolibacter aquiterrae]|uniref:ATP-binding protein n=1 Tax=Pinisolibacter aquiterrae TaxID=2815579 RepID=UPI001C3D2F75|nr:ATP-binding protein [Pinisolibacter aquiterrae]MBV5263143.1 PAS-domain containing protein [Pinisolibacter aquiterrae]MCC8234057.1 PAS-domain containing protein [Pinisolibacter aquiterrae]
MAQAESARESTWIPFTWSAFVGRPRLEGHIHLLASPTYRQVLRAEPWLRRSIPVLIVTFVVIMALTRVVGIMETRRALEDSARDEAVLIAATLAGQLGRAETRPGEAGWASALRPLLDDVLPERATADGRQILIADRDGRILAAHPTDPAFEGRLLTDVFGTAQPLTTFGARAGALSLTLTDGRRVLAALHHVDGNLGSIAVFQPEERIYDDWRRNLRTTLTLFAFTAVILLVLTYAYFAQVIRANSADALYAVTTARTETAFRRGRCGFWDWDLARGRFYWSASMFEMLGLESPAGLIGFGEVAKLVHPDDVDFASFANGLITGDIHTLDKAFRMRKADGGWLWFRVRAEVVDRTETGSRHLVGIAADITEHRRLVETTVAADLRLRDAIETISEAFVLWDADNRLVMCNSKYQQLHSLGDDDIRPGTPYNAVMKVARQPLVRQPVGIEGASDDGASSFEAEIEDGRWLQISERRTKDGGFVSVGTDITPLKRHEERLVESEKRLMGTVLDLRSSRRKLEIQAQQLVELAEKYSEEKVRAEEANKIKSDFLANISHELRTPLNAIIGFSEIMSQGDMLGAFGPEKYSEYSRDIHHSGMFLLNVINDILDMSKIEAGRMELAHEQVPLDEILAEAGRIISHAAEQRHLVVTPEVEPGLSFTGDRRAIKQVVLNLLSNAVKFTPEGGHVGLTAKHVDGAITIAIVDTGIGIPADHITSLGRPFVQVENQFTKSHKGSGLGLAIARSLVELQGGRMTIASTPDVGTTVTLTFASGANAEAAETDTAGAT